MLVMLCSGGPSIMLGIQVPPPPAPCGGARQAAQRQLTSCTGKQHLAHPPAPAFGLLQNKSMAKFGGIAGMMHMAGRQRWGPGPRVENWPVPQLMLSQFGLLTWERQSGSKFPADYYKQSYCYAKWERSDET